MEMEMEMDERERKLRSEWASLKRGSRPISLSYLSCPCISPLYMDKDI